MPKLSFYKHGNVSYLYVKNNHIIFNLCEGFEMQV